MSGQTIEIARFSTTTLAPEERYAAWLGWGWPRTDTIYRTEPSEPFDTSWATASLGDIIFVRTRISGMRYERRLQDIRRSDFEPIIVNMMVEGLAKGVFDGRTFREEAGSFHFHDLAKASIHTSTASLTYSLVVPRPLASEMFGALDDLHGLVIGGAGAALMIAYAERVWQTLPSLDNASAPSLGRSLLELLVAAAAPARTLVPTISSGDARLRQRALAFLESRFNAAPSVLELCSALGVSRRSIFAAFRGDGGLQNYIRVTRLDRAKAALGDLEREEPIGTIAMRLGFYDASHFTRLFRTRFGMAPRDYRRMLTESNSATSEGDELAVPRR